MPMQPCLGNTYPHISAPRQKFKNLVGNFFAIKMRSLSQKFQPSIFKTKWVIWGRMDGRDGTASTNELLKVIIFARVTADGYYPEWGCLVHFFPNRGWQIAGSNPQPLDLYPQSGAYNRLAKLTPIKWL